ncbi:MAG: Asp-tRNA(Asn)/Glu-tRNA(Gln) amidotransferase subunit GatB [Acidiferrobacteraceae bacterium]|jgi:aspartyl-tRNA(Asn)/glutamyl-tRNA(Gln) amidotransferase subunit B|nr:Asp-tRNA(Asn)/Glu-tRNA(Gln) amidotransferase subunit GatB [Acidiferrobacteraceae bacterium]MBT3639380.1 Asp-tRNA(Asn)/Glu-tRNA(Gln) amidotransferase subunit GatB [Acidiferrobacteraceae bacterium]MBT3770993.1 Asp-tRNA(Asn)/Glu-tRNA(Gln) amidotransferase subunit GatB [Acidiferrobacteraceae bacterium]MBT3973213.1 Asp-tRNA(Asn)/Glu-tRNA(Gln) amidotransferase subunit GatB [Acidiferrobacteraceae bacterium]MBT4394937.1 Asp-tRNA(Asn)/Glu-tRNA(Gln) amidotransferase subunit GatB [Acidiferrobacteraceae
MTWEIVIGLEVHAQLMTHSKIFSGASTAYGAQPNTQACAVDVGLPGVLPVMNREAALMAARFGLAVGATINRVSVFARKNYFYPDLPKGYQISQFEIPVVSGGTLEIHTPEGEKTIRITRAHLEEDAGKSLHEQFHGMTGIDLNRAGTPLLEIVSEPDMRSPAEAVAYLRKLHSLVRTLEICDGNMQEGSFRCDANISIRRHGDKTLGTRTELKNINSFRFVERALHHEIERQIAVVEDGGDIIQETRLYDPERDQTRSMRSKEEAHDYRYFPDPDLPPLVISEADLEQLRDELPELPDARLARFISDYDLGADEAVQLTSQKEIADYYENAVTKADGETRLTANWINGELMAWLNRCNTAFTDSPVSPTMLGQLVKRIQDKTISGKIAKEVFQAMWNGEGSADDVIASRSLTQITDSSAIEQVVSDVIARFPDQSEQIRAGQEKVIGFLVGQVMKATSGKANPQAVNDILKKQLLN